MTKCICVWYWFIFLPYISPILKRKSWRVISIDVSTKHHVIKAERAQTKKRRRCNLIPSEITLGRNYPSAGYSLFKNSLYEFDSALFVQMLHYFDFTIQLVYATCLSRKSEEPCIWYIKKYHKCMVFYKELVSTL